jgi:hypothetical protein
VRIFNLLETCTRPDEAEWSFEQLLVDNLAVLDPDLVQFRAVRARRLETFCSELLKKQWGYAQPPSWSHVWVPSGHLQRHERCRSLEQRLQGLGAEIEDHQHLERALSELRKSIDNLRLSRQRREWVETLLAALKKLELKEADSRAAFLDAGYAVPEDLGAAWEQTREAVGRYPKGWWDLFWFEDNRAEISGEVKSRIELLGKEATSLASHVARRENEVVQLQGQLTANVQNRKSPAHLAQLEETVRATQSEIDGLRARHQAELAELLNVPRERPVTPGHRVQDGVAGQRPG